MIRVFIADDHAIVREGLKQILADVSDMTVTGEASSGQETIIKVWEGDYDIVILDISMPGIDGLEALKQIKTKKPLLPVLILSVHAEEVYAVRAMKLRASGYITKDKAPDELVKAIREVYLGRKFITSSLAEKLAFALETETDKPLHEKLSEREYQVMRLIAFGKTTKEIAEGLYLSTSTVKTYRQHIQKKMGMKSNAELIHYAIAHHLLD